MKLTRLERIINVIDYTLEKMLNFEGDIEDNIFVRRYNFWMERLHRELDKDLNVDVKSLKISRFMEHIVTSYISRELRIQEIRNTYRGFRSGDKFHYNKQDDLIKDLYKIRG